MEKQNTKSLNKKPIKFGFLNMEIWIFALCVFTVMMILTLGEIIPLFWGWSFLALALPFVASIVSAIAILSFLTIIGAVLLVLVLLFCGLLVLFSPIILVGYIIYLLNK